MGKFAKLYDIGHEQLLVVVRNNDKGEPQVACITEIGGIEMTVAPTFTPKNTKDNIDAQEVMDGAWAAANEYFDSFDQEKAEEIRHGMVLQYEYHYSLVTGLRPSSMVECDKCGARHMNGWRCPNCCP